MQVFCPNNIKIYNLSCGRSLPDWISERKRRLLLKKDIDVRRRIELIQDFEMPAVSNNIKISKDGQYILATGIYKPRVRCFDVNNLSMKFDRCFNAEAVQFEMLSDDYSKFVILQNDRSVEFHVQHGSYYRLRVPKFGRDLVYHPYSCDLYFVGASPEMYRLNLEQGRFLPSVCTNASSVNKVIINPVSDMLLCGTAEGTVEAWDPRMARRIGILDCAMACVSTETRVNGMPSVTSLKCKGALTLAVGTATGQILLYDIRANKPFIVKDHMNELPVKNITFVGSEDLVATMDTKHVRFWNYKNGKQYTHIQAPADLNDMCIVPDTGLFFFANEDKKILTYYIPSIGPAPKWCSFLDNITEELEESKTETVYDDYKFVTKKELEDLGLVHLADTNLLRAYMHGYFMDIRLYNKAQALVKPFAYKEFQRKKIREKLEDERKNRVITKKLPAVNRVLAQKLLEQQADKNPNDKMPNLLEDNRFTAMFNDPEFAIDETAEEYNHIKPLLTKLDKANQKKKRISTISHEQFEAIEEEEEKKEYTSSEEESDDEAEEDESQESSGSDMDVEEPSARSPQGKKPKLYEIKDSESFAMLKKSENEEIKWLPLEERLKQEKETIKERDTSAGNKVVTFTLQKSESQKKREEQNKAHIKERALYRRPAKNLRK